VILMAVMIVISKIAFDQLFEETLNKLKLDNLESIGSTLAPSLRNELYALHRKFHYELCQFKDRIEGRVL
jgi:hypothetical protein